MREFNLKAYTNCDGKAKKASILLMKTKGYEVLGPADKEYYKNFDLSFKHSITKKIINIENEYRPSFEKIKLEFDTVHIPIRKKNSKCDYYFVWGNDYKEVGIIEMKDIVNSSENLVNVLCQSEIGEINTTPFTEDFIDVPKKFVTFYKINEKGLWKKNINGILFR